MICVDKFYALNNQAMLNIGYVKSMYDHDGL